MMMNSKKVLPEILGIKYSDAKSIINSLHDGQDVTIGEHTVTSLYRKTVSGQDIHYIRIEKDGKFVGKVGLE